MNAKRILTAVGIILIVIGIFKVSVLGYYPREAPLFIAMLTVGAICTFAAQKLPSK
jgi:hypothetical protein